MAIAICPECGGDVSTEALACPHCGNPTERDMTDCPDCGTRCVGNTKSCPKCRKRLGLTDAEWHAEKFKSEERIRIAECVIRCLFWFAFFLALLALYYRPWGQWK